jgi:hypothetical protein
MERCSGKTEPTPRAAYVSPPWYRKTHLQRRVIFAEWLRLPLHNRLPHHGGLTPPALVAVRTFAGKKRFFRCTNAGSQERRASARRGSLNRTHCAAEITHCSATMRHRTRAAYVSPPWYDADAGKSAVSHKRRIVRGAMRSESSAVPNQGGLSPAPMQAQRGCTTSG